MSIRKVSSMNKNKETTEVVLEPMIMYSEQKNGGFLENLLRKSNTATKQASQKKRQNQEQMEQLMKFNPIKKSLTKIEVEESLV